MQHQPAKSRGSHPAPPSARPPTEAVPNLRVVVQLSFGGGRPALAVLKIKLSATKATVPQDIQGCYLAAMTHEVGRGA